DLVPGDRASAAEARRAIHVQALALGAFAAIAALATLLILGQALARQQYLDAVEHPTLAALGMSRGQLFAVGMARPAVVVTGGAVAAAVVAVVLSPLTPTGLGGQAEPRPGVAVNVAVVGLALATVAVLLLARAALTAWRLGTGW